MEFELRYDTTGVEVIDSYKVFWDRKTINRIYKEDNGIDRSKFSLYLEWFIHTLCYKVGYKRDRAKNVFFEYGKEWFGNLFKKN